MTIADTSGLLALFNRTEPEHEAVRGAVAELDAAHLERASAAIARYPDQAVGIADASIVLLADRYRTREILTLDHRHFDALRPLSGGRFKLIP